MRSHFSNVKTMIEAAERYDMDKLVTMLKESEPNVLADDIAYIIITLMAARSPLEQNKMKEYLLDAMTDYEAEQLELKLNDDD